MASLSQACHALPCLVTMQWGPALCFSSIPTGEVGHLGPVPRRASEEIRPRGTVSWLPLSPMQGAVGSFRAMVAMQPCLFKESLAESRSTPAVGPVATPSTCPERRPAAQGCEAEGGPGQARRATAPCLPSWTHWQHCLGRDHGSWILPVTGVWPLDGEVRGDVPTKLFVGRGEWEGGSGYLKSLEGCQGPDREQKQRLR